MVRHALTTVLQRGEARDPLLQTAVLSVSEVYMSPDLKHATAFVTALGQNGVDAETFRDFVSAGLAWREYSRARFGEIARDIPRADLESSFDLLRDPENA